VSTSYSLTLWHQYDFRTPQGLSNVQLCDETAEVRPVEVHPLDRIDQDQQREVKPSLPNLANLSVRPPTPGSSPQPPTERLPGAKTQECQLTPMSANLAKCLASAEKYLGKFSAGKVSTTKESSTAKAVGILHKDRPKKAKKSAKRTN
jgi:hypothetical protein